ncbi:hypothetical protein LX87_00853 [Larkinella arboricola]|uniref:Uncharacterized protein n=1 Tax=Larkinella arboricola TaxID=643671 RepID=A0A327XA56_LARAB|nr:DUF6428 family protein [Larkinella arboricola]RAK02733.1 hypothetical protein LX87_00853 [Larkinella arboricola]
MNTTNTLTWQAFKNSLDQHPDKHLQIEYAAGQFVDPSFHITEIKQAPIVSVDCGGKMNSWTEIIVQLWEPAVKEADRSMKVSKALSIINRVESVLPLNPLATVKLEYGNTQFDARQLYPSAFTADDDTFTVRLTPDVTQCKAEDRGESCGVAPVKTVENRPQVSACQPGTGCC